MNGDKKDGEKKKFRVRHCDLYHEEYKECRRLRGRFHQYFTVGEFEDCKPWYQDYRDCARWVETDDAEALDRIIEHEDQRLKERLRGHLANDVWEKREHPPEDWNAPLPERLEREYEGTYLAARAKEEREGIQPRPLSTACVIS